ncbi:uncharacterized protein LAJ45_08773 [Morchella importuna]|uniref:uncharacterized protein n=1 Tax=Morchella importuna TaxID=1174673 RepID=UPI001E8CBCB3|nr:uncharacterized protein LAJ45_08773 [Morchella importuna]KAH8147295.1 hypothetical protein LAJ45_08773 [Morchella importuna]
MHIATEAAVDEADMNVEDLRPITDHPQKQSHAAQALVSTTTHDQTSNQPPSIHTEIITTTDRTLAHQHPRYQLPFFSPLKTPPKSPKMENDKGELVDLYVPRKCSATNRIIKAKDHASVQISVGKVDETGRYTGENITYALPEGWSVEERLVGGAPALEGFFLSFRWGQAFVFLTKIKKA